MDKLTQNFLKEILKYDPISGEFIWLKSGNKKVIGTKAGSIKKDRCGVSYLRIQINNKRYLAHRLAYLYVKGEFPEELVDHEDGDGLNNKWANLRKVDSVNNSRNRRISPKNTSGSCGVCFCNTKGMWLSQIGTPDKREHIGYFKNKTDAIAARKNREIELGFHVNHGELR